MAVTLSATFLTDVEHQIEFDLQQAFEGFLMAMRDNGLVPSGASITGGIIQLHYHPSDVLNLVDESVDIGSKTKAKSELASGTEPVKVMPDTNKKETNEK